MVAQTLELCDVTSAEAENPISASSEQVYQACDVQRSWLERD